MTTKKTPKGPYKQKPVPGTNRLLDITLKALPVGWRVSRTGKRYFENRENRSDTAKEIETYTPKPKATKKAPAVKPKKKTTAKRTAVKKPSVKKATPKKVKPRQKGQTHLF